MSIGRRSPPVWQWIAALGGACAFVVALIVFVDRESAASNQPAGVQPSALAEQNREARIVVGQDQQPHVVALRRGVAPEAALRGAVTAYMLGQVRRGAIPGPLTRVRCTAARGGGTSARLAYRCTAVAASVDYPFEGVVAPRARQVTYCKRDLPPVPSMNIPVSRRCT